MSALSIKQKACLAQVAARAYKVAGEALGYDRVADFRHAVAFDAVGKESFRAMGQDDYVPCFNAFARYAGERELQDNTPDFHARAVYILRDACARWGFAPAYVATIIADKFGLYGLGGVRCEDMCASLRATQIWQLVYTINTRGRAKTRKTSSRLGIAVPGEQHAHACTVPPGALASHFGATGPEEKTKTKQQHEHDFRTL